MSQKVTRAAITLSSRPVLTGNLESWADFVDDLKNLVDKAYPELEEAARERLAVNQYLQQLEQPQVAFSVKQKRPAKLDEAVSATLEMEAYTSKPGCVVASVQGEEEGESEGAVAVVGAWDPLATAVERLTARLWRLEDECSLPRQFPSKQYAGRQLLGEVEEQGKQG